MSAVSERSKRRRDRADQLLVGNFSLIADSVGPASRVKKFRRREPRPGQAKDVYAVQDSAKTSVVQIGLPVTDPAEAYDYALAVRDKDSGAVSFLPAHLLHFAPRFTANPKRLLGQTTAAEEATEEAKTPKEPRQLQRRSLIAKFGQDKRKKAVELATQREKAGVQSSASTLKGLANALDQTLRKVEDDDSSSLNTSDFGSTSTAPSTQGTPGKAPPSSQLLPPYNAAAKTPAEVYRFQDFLSQDELNAIWDRVQAMLKMKMRELMESGYKDLALGYLVAGRELPGPLGQAAIEGSGAERRGALVLFLDFLLRFAAHFHDWKRGKKQVVSRAELTKMAGGEGGEVLVNKLIGAFGLVSFNRYSTGERGWEVPKIAVDGVRVWALAAALALSRQSEVILEPWATLTGCQTRALTDIANMLGCVVTSTGTGPSKKTTARLKGPPGNAEAEATKAKRFFKGKR